MTPEQEADMREKSAPIKNPPEWARKYYGAKFGLGEAMKDIRTLLTAYDEQARELAAAKQDLQAAAEEQTQLAQKIDEQSREMERLRGALEDIDSLEPDYTAPEIFDREVGIIIRRAFSTDQDQTP